MRCSWCEPLLDGFLENALPPRRMREVAAHVRRCRSCEALLAELRVVDAVPHLPSDRGDRHQTGAIEHSEVLRHRLASHGQLLAEAGGRRLAADEEQVEHPAPGRVAERRPEVVVDLERRHHVTSPLA